MLSIKLVDKYKNELIRILELIDTKEILRMGKLFNTNFNNYFYDTGTGKVIELDDESFYIMNVWFDLVISKYDEFLNYKYINEENLTELLNVCINENLFKSVKPTKFYSPNHHENLNELINNNLEQLILELTGRCNLRCTYCIYNEYDNKSRNFNNGDMSIDIAKKTVDYFFKHSKNKMSITFYGGEPLIKFDILKYVIDYSLEKNKKWTKEISFSFTTNLTLVTEDIAKYLSNIPNLSILCSLDGPESIHNANRKKINGEGSYSNAINGLELLCKYFEKTDNVLSINAVYGPPYTYDKLYKIETFFSNLNFISKNININISYPSQGSIDNEEWLIKMSNNPKYKSTNYEEINPLWKWEFEKIRNGNISFEEKKPLNFNDTAQLLTRINNRYISDKPNDLYQFNGCCVPGGRRLYVDTLGDFYPCERIGKSPDIGNIQNGINCEKIKKFYVDGFEKNTIENCSKCWAIRLCISCYVNRYDEFGFNKNHNTCDGARRTIEKYLSSYHELLKLNKLDFLKDIKLI